MTQIEDMSGPAAERVVTVIVVDDHDVIRRGLELVIGSESGLRCVGVAANGLDAVTLACAKQPDVVVLDIGMPMLDGLGAARLIRQLCPDVRMIALSGSTDVMTPAAAAAAGFDRYLTKDVSPSEIVATIRHVAGAARLSRNPARTAVEATPFTPAGSPTASPRSFHG